MATLGATDQATIDTDGVSVEAGRACASCGRGLQGPPGYEMRTDGETEFKCLRCALLHPTLLLTSAKVALVVGTFLVLLNQGDKLIGSTPPSADLWWKIPLTYCVPFCVATYGALSNARRETA